MPALDLYQTLDEIGTLTIDGVFYRHTAPKREPLSGMGSHAFGGRWNPPGTETLYLARPLRTCRAEFDRLALTQPEGARSLLPRSVHTIAVTGLSIVDLTDTRSLNLLGLSMDSIKRDNWGMFQAVGNAADTLGMGGLLVPSASGVGEVLAVFVRHAHRGEIAVVRTLEVDDGEWASVDESDMA